MALYMASEKMSDRLQEKEDLLGSKKVPVFEMVFP